MAARRAAASLLLAADRRAATSLLACLPPSAATITKNLLADAVSSPAEIRAASSLLLAADRRACLPPSAATTTTKILLADTSILAQRAVLCPRGVVSSPAEIRRAATPILTGRITTTTIQIAAGSLSIRPAATAILARRPVLSSPTLPRAAPFHASRSLSTAVLGDRNIVSAPAHLASAGSKLARRGMATEALTPEVKTALELKAKADALRHEAFLKELKEFEREIQKNFSAGSLSSAETALTAGNVAFRVSTAVLAFGVVCLVAVLQTVEEGWKADSQEEMKILLEKMMEDVKTQLMANLHDIVCSELKLIEAKKAAGKK